MFVFVFVFVFIPYAIVLQSQSKLIKDYVERLNLFQDANLVPNHDIISCW